MENKKIISKKSSKQLIGALSYLFLPSQWSFNDDTVIHKYELGKKILNFSSEAAKYIRNISKIDTNHKYKGLIHFQSVKLIKSGKKNMKELKDKIIERYVEDFIKEEIDNFTNKHLQKETKGADVDLIKFLKGGFKSIFTVENYNIASLTDELFNTINFEKIPYEYKNTDIKNFLDIVKEFKHRKINGKAIKEQIMKAKENQEENIYNLMSSIIKEFYPEYKNLAPNESPLKDINANLFSFYKGEINKKNLENTIYDILEVIEIHRYITNITDKFNQEYKNILKKSKQYKKTVIKDNKEIDTYLKNIKKYVNSNDINKRIYEWKKQMVKEYKEKRRKGCGVEIVKYRSNPLKRRKNVELNVLVKKTGTIEPIPKSKKPALEPAKIVDNSNVILVPICIGNGEYAEDYKNTMQQIINEAKAKGLRVITCTFDYQNVAFSKGPIANKDSLKRNAKNVIKHMMDKYGLNLDQVHGIGHSIGGGAILTGLAELAKEEEKLAKKEKRPGRYPQVTAWKTFSNMALTTEELAKEMISKMNDPEIKKNLPEFLQALAPYLSKHPKLLAKIAKSYWKTLKLDIDSYSAYKTLERLSGKENVRCYNCKKGNDHIILHKTCLSYHVAIDEVKENLKKRFTEFANKLNLKGKERRKYINENIKIALEIHLERLVDEHFKNHEAEGPHQSDYTKPLERGYEQKIEIEIDTIIKNKLKDRFSKLADESNLKGDERKNFINENVRTELEKYVTEEVNKKFSHHSAAGTYDLQFTIPEEDYTEDKGDDIFDLDDDIIVKVNAYGYPVNAHGQLEMEEEDQEDIVYYNNNNITKSIINRLVQQNRNLMEHKVMDEVKQKIKIPKKIKVITGVGRAPVKTKKKKSLKQILNDFFSGFKRKQPVQQKIKKPAKDIITRYQHKRKIFQATPFAIAEGERKRLQAEQKIIDECNSLAQEALTQLLNKKYKKHDTEVENYKISEFWPHDEDLNAKDEKNISTKEFIKNVEFVENYIYEDDTFTNQSKRKKAKKIADVEIEKKLATFIFKCQKGIYKGDSKRAKNELEQILSAKNNKKCSYTRTLKKFTKQFNKKFKAKKQKKLKRK